MRRRKIRWSRKKKRLGGIGGDERRKRRKKYKFVNEGMFMNMRIRE